MNRVENRMVDNLDRASGNQDRSATRRAIRSRVSAAVTHAVQSEAPQHRDEAAKVAAETARDLYAAHAGEENACSLHGRLAKSQVADLHRAVARSRAEQVFATEGLKPIRTPLASGLRAAGLGVIADQLDAAND